VSARVTLFIIFKAASLSLKLLRRMPRWSGLRRSFCCTVYWTGGRSKRGTLESPGTRI